MTDSTSDPSSVPPGAIPFWKSPVVLGVVVSLLTAAAAKFNLQAYITGANVNDLANWILQGASWVAGLVALHARVTSSVQPVTLTQGAADAKSTSPPQAGFASVGLLTALALVAAVAACALPGCATVTKIDNALTSPAAQPYIDAAMLAAAATAETQGVTAAQINRIATAALQADKSTAATLATVSAAVNSGLAKLKLPAGDMAAVAILEVAIETAINAKVGANPTVALTQAAAADVLQSLITATAS